MWMSPNWAAAWFVCLPALLQAFPGDGSQVYTVAVPASVAPAKVEFQVAYGSLPGGWATPPASLGGWEVTVAFDTAHCVIHCTYRRTREALLLKPITSIRIYSGPGSKPTTVIVDPAGLRLPSIASQVITCPEQAGLPGRRWAARFPAPHGDGRLPASIHAAASLSATHAPAALTPALPLRV